jgi:hypothetical protein
MSCPTCSTCTPETPCNSCGSYVSIENGRVQPISAASNVRVSDRNGLPRNLVSNTSALASTDKYGEVKMRDGSTDNPINLALLRSVVAATKGVVIIDGEGNIAHLPKSDVDSYLTSQGGVIKWDTSMPRSNVLTESDLAPYRNKLLTIGCTTNGLVEIGFLSLAESDYIGIDSEQKPIGRQFCDADSVDLLDSIFGCKDGVLSKLTGVANKRLLVNGDGKFYLDDAVDTEVWVGGSPIWTKILGRPNECEFTEVVVPFGGNVPNTALWVQINLQFYCGTSSELGRIRLFINDVPLLVSSLVGDLGTYDGDVCLYIPYGTGSFKIKGSFVSYSGSSPGSAGPDGEITVTVLSYK